MASTRQAQTSQQTGHVELREHQRSSLDAQKALVEQARAEAQAGQTISRESIKAWIESWDTSAELPQPLAGT